MLELRNISVEIEGADGPRKLLTDVAAAFSPGAFHAVIGPSGCGKSTLIKAIAGLLELSEGSIFWQGRDLEKEDDFSVGELAYVPQFSIAHEPLTVAESLGYAIRLRVAGLADAARRERVRQVLEEVGLLDFAARPVKVLSGGQRRRLALALELLSHPALLLCDEATSGLDPRSEDEIVRLLSALARQGSRTVLSVTHSLRQIGCYDGVTVLYQGRLAFHGHPSHLAGYFGISDPEEVYDRLAESSPAFWAEQWNLACGGPV
ncbi:MAG: ABC transporter ATP-binding protein [Verrucomicrobium sp.]|nr:ABC transporter ATP-binding protein [Verrucomicrobium sp.]